jgi:hypothetical protein
VVRELVMQDVIDLVAVDALRICFSPRINSNDHSLQMTSYPIRSLTRTSSLLFRNHPRVVSDLDGRVMMISGPGRWHGGVVPASSTGRSSAPVRDKDQLSSSLSSPSSYTY